MLFNCKIFYQIDDCMCIFSHFLLNYFAIMILQFRYITLKAKYLDICVYILFTYIYIFIENNIVYCQLLPYGSHLRFKMAAIIVEPMGGEMVMRHTEANNTCTQGRERARGRHADTYMPGTHEGRSRAPILCPSQGSLES